MAFQTGKWMKCLGAKVMTTHEQKEMKCFKKRRKTTLYNYRHFISTVVADNRKEATINRALDGSMYPG